MRQGPNGRRGRGRPHPGGSGSSGNNGNGSGNSNGHGNGGPPARRSAASLRNQNFDSNGPEVRVRGNAWQVHEKYQSLARDASSSGDRVAAENYLQHAEHYYRIIEAINEATAAEQQVRGYSQQPDTRNFHPPSGAGPAPATGEGQVEFHGNTPFVSPGNAQPTPAQTQTVNPFFTPESSDEDEQDAPVVMVANR
ncbi:MAG: DUF4167 domain-containing protein [Alphaproteobacteria bacterium]